MLGVKSLLLVIFFYWPLSAVVAAASMNNLKLLGKGEAYYLGFIKVYDAALYSEELHETDNILNSDVSKCLHIVYAVDIDRDELINSANTILTRQFNAEKLHRVKTELEILHGGYRDVAEGDSYTLCYNGKDNKTSLSFNGGELVSVSSAEFANVYFSIWLSGNAPLDKKLRKNLLDGAQNS